MAARYLLRLDDACPTIRSERWDRLEALFDELGIRPIVAIVPDNQDPDLQLAPADPGFWDRARRWQRSGWTIGLHGFRHILRECRAPQYLPFHPRSEFAGVALDVQGERLRLGWKMLADEGLPPSVWVAPAHSFDRDTLRALASETPIRIVSDGIARDHYFADGFHWLPQQLWALAPKSSGLWTVCLHPNSMNDADFAALSAQLRGPYRGKITSVDAIDMAKRPLALADRVEIARFWTMHHYWRARELAKKTLLSVFPRAIG